VIASVADDAQLVFHLGWSRWRRAHQALAQRCHRARRTREGTAPCVPQADATTAHPELTDAEWERVRSLLPPQRPRTSRPRHDHRTILGGILWVLWNACPWREMPARFGKWDTAYARYRLWRTQGLWSRLIDALGRAPPPHSETMGVGVAELSL
jgi:hypothetical protein